MRERGFSVLEVTITLAVVTILLTAALGGVRAHQVSVAREFQRLEVSRAAGSRIEERRDASIDVRAGETIFDPGLRGADGVETITEVEPGLYRLDVLVTHEGSGVRVALTTLLARRVAP